MRFKSLRAHKIGPFEDISIDFDGLQGLVVAVTGANGVGKSTMLELLYGCIYRTTPTRGPLSGLATARDSWAEATVVNGATHTIRHIFDNVSGKSEALVTDEEGVNVTSSAKVREFDAFSTAHFPHRDVYDSSEFAAQGSTGFMGKSTGEKKAVVLRSLGVERLEAMAETARARARGVREELRTLDARIADEKARGGSPEDVAADLAKLRTLREETASRLTGANSDLEKARALAGDARAALIAYNEAVARRAKADNDLKTATAKVADLEARIGRNRAVLAQADQIRAATARATEISGRLDVLTDTTLGLIPGAQAHVVEAQRAIDAAASAQVVARVQHENATTARDRAVAILIAAEEVAKAVDELPGQQTDLARAQEAVTEAERLLEEARGLAQDTRDQRIKVLRGGLLDLADPSTRDDASLAVDDTCDRAQEVLAEDDKIVADTAAAPAAIEAARRAVGDAKGKHEALRAVVAKTERLAARAPEMTNAAVAQHAAEEQLKEATWKRETAAKQRADAEARKATAEEVLAPLRAEAAAMKAEELSLAPLIAKLPPLASAEARIAELEPQFVDAMETRTRAERAVQDAVVPAAHGAVDLVAAEALVATCDGELRATEAKIAVGEARLATVTAAAARIAQLDGERRRLDDDLSDWARLGDDLGAQGLQALVVDCAGPEISAVANDLLQQAFGSRFTIRLDTTKRSADGKKDLEVFDITILDTERGREGTADTFSGGEKVIISEALALALTTVSCGRQGMTGATLIRDESGAALDEENGRKYIAMLRRAAELVSADRVLFVTHSAELAALADARIVVADGGAHVEIGAAA